MEEKTKPYDIKHRCYEFSKQVVLYINALEFGRIHYSILDQLLRSATSIGANVIEAKSGNSRRNLVNFYSIALRSANETKYWLCLVRDAIKIEKGNIDLLIKEADEISKILAKSIISLKKNMTS